MIMNYNNWFYEFNKYIHGNRGYNDDSWVDIGDKYKNLINLHSQLFEQQPFGVVGNRRGFEQLTNLMVKSNYRFNEIDDALLKTYEYSLKGAMSGMLVNTHTVIFHAKDLKDDHIHNQYFESYFIADVPYDQMHFGERDEFIRQKLDKMHDSVNEQYIPFDEFTSNPFTSILGFSVICTINGLICNDFLIGFDDQGLKFKFRYGGVADAEVIIYKLDNTTVNTYNFSSNHIKNGKVSIDLSTQAYNSQQCIIDIFNSDYTASVQVVPNFGYVEDGKLKIDHIQKGTLNMMELYGESDLKMVVFHPKFMREVNGVYPMANYLNLAHVSGVYTDLGNDVRNRDGKTIVASDDINRYEQIDVPKCTPPICLDRDCDFHFDDLVTCVNIRAVLNQYIELITDFTNNVTGDWVKTYDEYVELVKEPLTQFYSVIFDIYKAYVNIAMITAMIKEDLIDKMSRVVDSVNILINLDKTNYRDYIDYVDEYLLMPSYEYWIDYLTEPFKDKSDFEPFMDIYGINENFNDGVDYTSHQYNRPVSEQCFIALRWSRDNESWVFDYPEIKHFRGIENTFFINSSEENSVFKFFVLYTDTFYPSADIIDDTFQIEDVLDYDEFITQTENYLGFIRYWDVENQLMRLSKLLYNKYDDEHVVHVLSDILCNRLDTKDILNTYWSDIKYSRANITSDNYSDYTEISERAPFAINFLFYTLSALNGEPDQLQAFFYDKLTKEAFEDRYMDYNVSAITDEAYKLPYNFSQYFESGAINQLISAGSSNPKMDNNRHLYYGASAVFQGSSVVDNSAYAYTFNAYDRIENTDGSNIKLPLVIDHGYDDTYYISQSAPINPVSYYYDIKLAKLITRYLTCVRTYISHIETNYSGKYNLRELTKSTHIDLYKCFTNISGFLYDIPDGAVHHIPASFVTELRAEPFALNTNLENGFMTRMEDIYDEMANFIGNYILKNDIGFIKSNNLVGTAVSIHRVTNWLAKQLNYVYSTSGYQIRTDRRIKSIYTHFKKFNLVQTPYTFKQLHLYYDKFFIKYDFGTSVSNWNSIDLTPEHLVGPNINEIANLCTSGENFSDAIDEHSSIFAKYYTALEDLQNLKNTYLATLEEYVNNVVNKYMFDLYIIDQIIPESVEDEDMDTVITLSTKPAYVRWTVIRDEYHKQFVPPSLDSYPYPTEVSRSLYFAVNTVPGNDRQLKRYGGIIKHCEYAFFDGTTIPSTDNHALFEFISESGSVISSVKCTVTFRRVGNTADLTQDINLMLNGDNVKADFQNIHEDVWLNEDFYLTEVKAHDTNYEMLLANRYTQLDSFYEAIATFKRDLQGPVDRVYINNQDINNFILSDIGSKPTSQLFFKPCQIIHGEINVVSKSTYSVGSGLTEGQKIYLITDDDLHYVFPAYVTKIDHSKPRGFVEAVVDSRHAKWFDIPSNLSSYRTKYLEQNVQCIIVDDNYTNFYDEFNNRDYKNYQNPTFDSDLEYEDENYPEMYSTLGDPVYVQNNADYIYTRLNYFINPSVENRFIDEEHKKWRFIYLGKYDASYPTVTHRGDTYQTHVNYVWCKMFNVDRCNLTDPEKYPILYDDPNDHDVRLLEEYTFKQYIDDVTIENLEPIIERIDVLYERLRFEDLTPTQRKEIHNEIDELRLKEKYYQSLIDRINEYIDEPEKATKWFNVTTYEDAETYMNSNKCKMSVSFQSHITDIPLTEKLSVYLYDWEHKHWIDPSIYQVYISNDYRTNFDVGGDYTTPQMVTGLNIVIRDNSYKSHSVLVYLAYEDGHFLDDPGYEPFTKYCNVRFKPILSTNNDIPEDPDALNDEAYKDLTIRKNIDIMETYSFKAPYIPEDFSNERGYWVKRYKTTVSNEHTLRNRPATFAEMEVKNFHDYDVYVKLPFKDVTTDREFVEHQYEAIVLQEIDNFVPGEKVNLICISSNADYNGNISSIMFEGVTDYDGANNQIITITRSTVPDHITGLYTCTIIHDSRYKSSGGFIRITVINENLDLMDEFGKWIKIPLNYLPYQQIPDEFIIVAGGEGSLAGLSVIINPKYMKSTNDIINKKLKTTVTYSDLHRKEEWMYNPFEFYYNYKLKLRYPLSNIRKNEPEERLTYVDPTTATKDGITVVRTNYLHVCRYSLANIPVDGIIDVTGYVPTPLSRKRYEWWVNGKQLIGNKNLIITSPTSFQLINLTSLKNFELVELVDDLYESALTNRQSIYIDLNGGIYTSYKQAFMSNNDVVYQQLKFSFNGYPNHDNTQVSTTAFIRNPNNVDVDKDILDTWIDDTAVETNDYNDLYNIPRINETPIYHPLTDDLGLHEIPNSDIIEQLNDTWKYEILTYKSFPTTHMDDSMIKDQQYLMFHIKEENDKFVIYTTGTFSKYFTLYMSKSEYAGINSLNNTIKIIPFIHTGIRIEIDKSVRGLWLHATCDCYIPKKIQ